MPKLTNFNLSQFIRVVVILVFSSSAFVDASAVDLLALKYPNYLKFGVPNKTSPFSLLESVPVQIWESFQLVYEPLIGLNSNQELHPALAESWQVNNEGTEIVFTIQAEHFFSDGTPVTAESVANSFLMICKSKTATKNDLKGLLGCENGAPAIQIISPLKLQFTVNVNPTLFLYQLTSPRLSVAKWGNKTELPIGSGPYSVLETTEDYLVLKENPHASFSNKPKNSGLILRYVSEDNANESLESHFINGTLMYRATPSTKVPKDYELISDQANITQALIFNNQRFPFNYTIVRQAIAADIYNKGILMKCSESTAPAFGMIPTGLGGSISQLAPQKLTEISPAEVFSAVRSLGHRTIPVTIHRHSGRRNDCEAAAITTTLQKFHIRAHFKYHATYDSLWPLYLNHNLDAFIELYVFPNREAYGLLRRLKSSASDNFANVKDPTLDDLIDSIWSAPSSQARFKAYGRVNDFIQRNAKIVPLYYLKHNNFVDTCIRGIAADYAFNPFSALQNLWLDKKCDHGTLKE